METRKAEASLGPALLAGSWRPATANAEDRTVELVWSSGADVPRQDFMTGQLYLERLKLDPESVDLSRLQAGAPLLDDHASRGIRNQIGVVEAAWIAGGKGHAKVRFSERAADIFADVQTGIIRNVSIGYARTRERTLKGAKRDGLPIRLVERWEPHEISLVAIPADAGAQIRRKEEFEMPTEERAASGASDQAQAAEAIRRNEIRELVTRAKLPGSFAETLITENATIETARTRVIDRLADQPHNRAEIDHRFSPGDGARELDFTNRAADAMLVRERVINSDDRDVQQLATRSLLELGRMMLEMDGHFAPTSQRELVTRVISSTTLADTIANVSSRSLLNGYEAQRRTFLGVFREESAKNFRSNERVKLSDAPALELVAEGDDYPEGTLSDRKETYTLATYGKRLVFTRQMLINDDLGAITKTAQAMGFAAGVMESDVAWAALTANGNMSDAAPIVGAATNNLVTTTAISVAALEAARAYFRTAESENGVKLGLEPRWLIVGPDQESAVEKILRPPVSYSNSTLANSLSAQLANSLTLVIEPRIAAGDWYVLGDTRQVDTLEFAWLQGQRGPFVERETVFNSGAVQFKVTDDFGAGCVDRIAIYKGEA